MTRLGPVSSIRYSLIVGNAFTMSLPLSGIACVIFKKLAATSSKWASLTVMPLRPPAAEVVTALVTSSLNSLFLYDLTSLPKTTVLRIPSPARPVTLLYLATGLLRVVPSIKGRTTPSLAVSVNHETSLKNSSSRLPSRACCTMSSSEYLPASISLLTC